MTRQPRTHHLFGDVPWDEALCARQPGCEGSGRTRDAQGRAGMCTCQIGRGLRGAQRVRASRIPPRHFQHPPVLVTSPALAAHVATVEQWARDWRPRTLSGLLLTGPPRTGKSLLAGSTAVHMLGRLTPAYVIDEPSPVVWVSWPEYLARIRDTYGRGRGDQSESETDVLDEIARAQIAVIDDLGAESRSGSDWTEGTLCRILESATTQLSPTLIVTSNLPWRDIPARYGERVAGRLLEAISGDAGALLAFDDVPNYFAAREPKP